MQKEEPKFKPIVEGANKLSLGISIVVAVLLGVGIGKLLQNLFGYDWLLWVGVFWGVAAAGLNIYKMYKEVKKELDSIKDDPKYKYNQYQNRWDDEIN
jgi:F0F1-type ATP synthase assembly protein I